MTANPGGDHGPFHPDGPYQAFAAISVLLAGAQEISFAGVPKMVSMIGAEHTAFSEPISPSTPGLVPQTVGLQNGEFVIVWTNSTGTPQSSFAGLYDQTGAQYHAFSKPRYRTPLPGSAQLSYRTAT